MIEVQLSVMPYVVIESVTKCHDWWYLIIDLIMTRLV